MIIPPFAGVKLVECEHEIKLTPYYWCREFVGMGRCRACEIRPESDTLTRWIFDHIFKRRKVWVVMCWRRYEDGREEILRSHVLDPLAKEKDARRTFKAEVEFTQMTKGELEELARCFKATDDDRAYVENRFPNFQECPTGPGSAEARDLYQARLEVLAGMQPHTVSLIHKADETADPAQRQEIEREAVQAYFADMAQEWTDEQLKEWQRSNPLDYRWLSEIGSNRGKPRGKVDPVNAELALNWLRQKYDLMTAEELAKAIFAATGRSLSPATIKKRRERLGLTTARKPGPRPNSEE